MAVTVAGFESGLRLLFKLVMGTSLTEIALKADGKCYICGMDCDFRRKKAPLKAVRANIHHIIPLSKGGTQTEGNLVLTHQYCNSRVGNSRITDELRSICKEKIQCIASQNLLVDCRLYFYNFFVKPRLGDRAIRLEPDWWATQNLIGGDLMVRAVQGGLCNGK
jgi:hypothetical protein